jgi:lipopolysaccharide transport system ATP-binding protein
MSDTIIKVEGLGKRYFISHEKQGSYTAMRDVISNNVKGFGKSIQRMFRNDSSSSISGDEIEEFWALKNIDFEIKRGDAVGIIGRNGAGKSTLLKVLSRITEQTVGRVEIKGRLSSLLEVGTGFHPELSGRENIFLNGAILGMSRAEIKSKFDEIVDFSGVEKFLDTPVKRYSSGMYVRLAFAVAAHLESEILVVDEVLAVGDAEFQKKCLGKMGDVVKGEGRTVIFVSHNMQAIKKFCEKGIFLENGSIKMVGEINSIIDNYMYRLETESSFIPIKIREIGVLLSKIILNSDNGGIILPYKSLKIEIELIGDYDLDTIGAEIMISHENVNGYVFTSNSKTKKNIEYKIRKGKNTITCLINNFNLCSGKYRLGFGLSFQLIKYYYYEVNLLTFEVKETIVSPSILPTLPVYGHVYLDHEWLEVMQ